MSILIVRAWFPKANFMSELLEKRIIHLTKLAYSLTIENEELKLRNKKCFLGLKKMHIEALNFKYILQKPVSSFKYIYKDLFKNLSNEIYTSLGNIYNLNYALVLDQIQKSNQMDILNDEQDCLKFKLSSLTKVHLDKCADFDKLQEKLEIELVKRKHLDMELDKERANSNATYFAFQSIIVKFKQIHSCFPLISTKSKIVQKSPPDLLISVVDHYKLCLFVCSLNMNTAMNMRTIYNKLANFKFDFKIPTSVNYKKLLYEYHVVESIDVTQLAARSSESLAFTNSMKSDFLKLTVHTPTHFTPPLLKSITDKPCTFPSFSIKNKLNFIKMAVLQSNSKTVVNNTKIEADKREINRLAIDNATLASKSNEYKAKLAELRSDVRYLQKLLPRNDFVTSHVTYQLRNVIPIPTFKLNSIFTFFSSFLFFKSQFDKQNVNLTKTRFTLLKYQLLINAIKKEDFCEMIQISVFSSSLVLHKIAPTIFTKFIYPDTLALQVIQPFTRIKVDMIPYTNICKISASWEIIRNQINWHKSQLTDSGHMIMTLENSVQSLTTYNSQIKQRQINWTKNVCRQLLVLSLICKQIYKVDENKLQLPLNSNTISTAPIIGQLVFPSVPFAQFMREPILDDLHPTLEWNFKASAIYQLVYALQTIKESYNYKMNKMEIQFFRLSDSNETLQSASSVMVNDMKHKTTEIEKNKEFIRDLEDKEVHLHSRVGELQFQIHKFKMALREKDDQMYRMFNNKLNVRK